LTETGKFSGIAPFFGQWDLERSGGETATLGLLIGFVPNQSDAWTFTLDHIKAFFDSVLMCTQEIAANPLPEGVSAPSTEVTSFREQIDGFFMQMIDLLGTRTAQMHRIFAMKKDDADFRPEPFSQLYQRSVFQAMGSQARAVLRTLKAQRARVPDPLRGAVDDLLGREAELQARFRRIVTTKISAKKVRIHGDLHLGQVLFTGKDMVIIDLEGEPARPLSERRFKRSVLRDVAGMLRSFHYAAHAALYHSTAIRPEDRPLLQKAAEDWYHQVAERYLRAYFTALEGTDLVPRDQEQMRMLLEIYLLDKAVYELGYELNNRPDWLGIPLFGILGILGQD